MTALNKIYVHGVSESPLPGLTVGEFLDSTVARDPHGQDLVVSHQGTRWSWARLSEEVNHLAAGLLDLGIKPGDRLGILSPDNAEWVVTQFAGTRRVQMDGNDVLAMLQVVGESIEKTRGCDGPCPAGALSYGLSDLTTADDASWYRRDEEVTRHWRKEPIARLRNYMTRLECWSKDDEEALIKTTTAERDPAAEQYLATLPRPPASLFDHLYEKFSAALTNQRDALGETSYVKYIRANTRWSTPYVFLYPGAWTKTLRCWCSARLWRSIWRPSECSAQ